MRGGEGDREFSESKEVNVEKGRDLNERDEERSVGHSVTKPATMVQVWLKVRRNFLMYVGESISRWLAFIPQPGGLSRDVPILPLPLTSRNLVN